MTSTRNTRRPNSCQRALPSSNLLLLPRLPSRSLLLSRVQIFTGESDGYERWSSQIPSATDINQARLGNKDGRKIGFPMTYGRHARGRQAPGMKTLDDTYLPRDVHAQA